MGCGCQDKERDARILEYHYMKKAKQQGYPESPGTIILTWEGNILDIQMFDIGLENVLSIRKIGERLYTATVLVDRKIQK